MIYYYGTVVKNQTPMFFSFDDEHVEFVAHHLAVSIEQAYEEDGQALVEQHGHNEDREQRHNASGAEHKSRDTQLHTMSRDLHVVVPHQIP